VRQDRLPAVVFFGAWFAQILVRGIFGQWELGTAGVVAALWAFAAGYFLAASRYRPAPDPAERVLDGAVAPFFLLSAVRSAAIALGAERELVTQGALALLALGGLVTFVRWRRARRAAPPGPAGAQETSVTP
jgi:hypothetical protein